LSREWVRRHRWIDMNSPLRFVLVLLILLVTSQRLPAPISEPDEKVTPAPEESAKPKVKHSPKPKVNDEDNEASDKSRAKKSEQSSSSSTPRPSGKAKNLSGPSPQVPAEAGKQHLNGKGTYLLHFDQTTGTVTDVTVVQSTGSPILDGAAIAAFRQWHEDPNCAKEVTMTMTFAAPGTQQ
jgi:TonB family protein